MDKLTVSTFPNAKALPLWAGLEQGIFERHEIEVSLHETGSSDEQRKSLANGSIHIVQAALDNALEMIRTGEKILILMGGESGMNDFVVRPSIHSFEEIRGQTLAVDSPHTAYALLARKLLANHGLELDRDYFLRPVGNGGKRLRALKEDQSIAGAVLNPPFSAEAELMGLRSLGRLDDLLGPYQAGGAFALHGWVDSHGETVVRYIASYLDALDWLTSKSNEVNATEILSRRLGLSDAVARSTYAQLCSPTYGFTPRAKLSHEGFDNMLAIRKQATGDDGSETLMRNAIDESFYNRAIAQEKRLS